MSFSDHAGTRVDAPEHFSPTSGALAGDEPPQGIELQAPIIAAEEGTVLQKSGQDTRRRGTVLLHMSYNKRVPFDDPQAPCFSSQHFLT